MQNTESMAQVAQRIARVDLSPVAERDLRADASRRSLSCDHGRISIARKLQGIAMRIDVPSHSYFGVLLSVLACEDGEPFFRISMPHSDPDFAICLYESRSDENIVAVWKAWARYFSLPKLLERTPGELETGEKLMGCVAVTNLPKWRRRGGMLHKRRSRMSLRRRVGDCTRMSAVHRGESQLATPKAGTI